jgi:thiol-disulfide isomerase/thioredoxin
MKILKFGAVWCPACLVMKPRWEKIENKLPWLKTQYFDFDKDKKTIEKYQLNSGKLPVFIFLDNQDKEILRLQGEIPKEGLIKIVNQLKDK